MIKIYESVTVRNNMSLRIRFGQATVRFDFERGNVAKGIRARYITNDPFMQRVLDTSDSLNNLYRLAKSIPESGDDTTLIDQAAALREKAQAAAQAAYEAIMNGQNAIASQTAEQSGTATADQAAEQAAEQSGTVAESQAAEQSGTAAESQAAEHKGTSMKDMKFADAAEAIIYVMQNYGEQVESLDAATKILRKHKINPVIG